ncbi:MULTISPECIES: acetamidase/formamidase family protein [unclassified Sporosarcina]|uniref:acetamidase/formamidase family protein n=1 Tax=unclassified Sporosarcina TaxID=2647733 RepID=UPI00203EF051|nr:MULTISPECIES: acetamidase/formamidase family protein [unclassified Sporosarcina]GKV65959.1 acetamidase [Sporosarcina sp. NCCP-2331]GLB56041.1 acetamidase [Sporosarcina sp. NCCP-2378]
MKNALETVFVNSYIDGLLNPSLDMLGPVKDGGHIVANTAPGCWGPMITPCIKGGHEVTRPVYVEGAEVGDAIAVFIKSIEVTSKATASGHDQPVEGRFLGDPFVAARCPECDTLNPQTVIDGIGPEAIRCSECHADITPFVFTNGYTMAFNENGTVGVTLPKEAAEEIAANGRSYMATPAESVQNPIVTFAPSDIPGVMARMRPFLGQLGTTPSAPMPDSHNAGDFGSFLIGAPHAFAFTKEELDEHRTDGHMDINRVCQGAVLICPVKVEGGGVYLGDMHAMQGDGEIAGHTTDVSGLVHLQVKVLKGVSLEGPVLLPNVEDLPYTAKPFTEKERESAMQVAGQWGVTQMEESYPVSFVGTGCTLNEATDNGLERAADCFEVTVPEIMNRATITGSIEIGRHPGVVTVTFLAPKEYLEKAGLAGLVMEKYR